MISKFDKLNVVGVRKRTGKERSKKMNFILLETSFLSMNVYIKYKPRMKKSASNTPSIAQENISKLLLLLFHKIKSKTSHKEKKNVIPSKHFDANELLFFKNTKNPKNKDSMIIGK
ncbi:MAG: hypothetical protein PHH40_00700 [Candidatus Moranbacteria bacterium]|nr:hypothetical protein [Candidatus Moranbacteria bacterium]MDD3964832.1 hypothetical protein [Candidatus Moranbacteria bacterium]